MALLEEDEEDSLWEELSEEEDVGIETMTSPESPTRWMTKVSSNTVTLEADNIVAAMMAQAKGFWKKFFIDEDSLLYFYARSIFWNFFRTENECFLNKIGADEEQEVNDRFNQSQVRRQHRKQLDQNPAEEHLGYKQDTIFKNFAGIFAFGFKCLSFIQDKVEDAG